MFAFVSHVLPSFPARHAPQTCRNTPTMRHMRLRPCIDLHEGRVKQIVGSTLNSSHSPETNFDSSFPASHYAQMYKRDDLPGGHVIMLGPGNEDAAIQALNTYPDGLQIGGGINAQNASSYIEQGASHVIVTSYVFRQGEIIWERVEELVKAIGKDRLVLDVSCRQSDGLYYVCTDRWQNWTQFVLNGENIGRLGEMCDEILVHAVDVEGKKAGIDLQLVQNLAQWATVPITYAGGVRNVDDLEMVKMFGRGYIDVTVGSALDIFGGQFKYEDAVKWQREQQVGVR